MFQSENIDVLILVVFVAFGLSWEIRTILEKQFLRMNKRIDLLFSIANANPTFQTELPVHIRRLIIEGKEQKAVEEVVDLTGYSNAIAINIIANEKDSLVERKV